MAIVVLLIQGDHKICLIPIGPTDVLQPADFLPPGPPLAEVVVHLLTSHFYIGKFRKVSSNCIQVDFLEPFIYLQPLPYKVRETAEDKP